MEHSADEALFVIITPEGNLIRFAPRPIIFRPDGLIQQCIRNYGADALDDGLWQLPWALGRRGRFRWARK
jgi:hypothetical protein